MITDPANFAKPLTLDRYWLYQPNEKIPPFNCTVKR
jgi:hypothetical protein